LAKKPWKACCELLAIAYPFPVAGFQSDSSGNTVSTGSRSKLSATKTQRKDSKRQFNSRLQYQLFDNPRISHLGKAQNRTLPRRCYFPIQTCFVPCSFPVRSLLRFSRPRRKLRQYLRNRAFTCPSGSKPLAISLYFPCYRELRAETGSLVTGTTARQSAAQRIVL